MSTTRTPEHAARVRLVNQLQRPPLVMPASDPRVVTPRDHASEIGRATRAAALANLDGLNR